MSACKGYYGISQAVLVAKGTKSNIKPWLIESPCFGSGKSKPNPYWTALGRALQAQGYIG